jgi:hypothetical protein
MSIYNIYLGYGGGIVDKAAGVVGFTDNTPGTGKKYRLPPFNQIKIEIWGAGGSGGGGDHNVFATGTNGTSSKLVDFGLEAGGGGAGIGGKPGDQARGLGGGGGVATGTYPVGVIVKTNGVDGTRAQKETPGQGGDSGNGPGTGAGSTQVGSAQQATGNPGGAPGGGGGGGGYNNGSSGGGKKGKKADSSVDAAGGGGGGGGAYASASFIKGQIPQRMLITYDVGAGGIIDPAEFPGGDGANGRIRITWS